MKIGVVGVGMVGGAISFGFTRIGHEVLQHDVKMNTSSIASILEAPIVFVCVPTPMARDGSCDVSAVESVVGELRSHHYGGLVVIKSTVIPGTTDRLRRETGLWLAFCPEFLRERAAFSDFVEANDVCIAGVHDQEAFERIKEAHGSLPRSFAMVTPVEAELTKYFSNVFNALRVCFANEFFDVCEKMEANYTAVKNAVVRQRIMVDSYLEANERFRAFGGSCLPKDTRAFARFVADLGCDLTLFDAIVAINERYKKT